MPQLLKKLADVGANLCRIGIPELSLQFCNDLGEGALAVAALEHLPPRPLQLDRAFGEQDHAFFVASFIFRPPAAAHCEARLAGIFGRRHVSCPRFETRPEAAIPAARRRSRARRVAPRECRTCRAGPGSPTPARLASWHCRRHSSPRTANPPAPDKAWPRNNRDLPKAKDRIAAASRCVT